MVDFFDERVVGLFAVVGVQTVAEKWFMSLLPNQAALFGRYC